MKVDEPAASTSGAGDISPISGTVAALSDDASKVDEKPAESKRPRKEPTSEKLSNFSRVTPAQLAHISFAPDGRYQPVRPVATRSAQKTSKGKAAAIASSRLASVAALGIAAERYAGGGGILILIDQTPGEPAEYIETEIPKPAPAAESAVAPVDAPATSAPAPAAARHIALDENEPEAQPPESFEVSDFFTVCTR